jgi:uncharacterized protein (TIGR02117 family)
MSKLVIFPVIFFFLNTSPKLSVAATPFVEKQIEDYRISPNDSLHLIYLIKQRWHTAVVFNTQNVDTTILPEAKYFTGAKLIDIGWGDEAFYQHPDFDWELAYQALFYPTPSTLRIEGIFISKQQYFDISEIVVELKINNEQLKILLKYISDRIWKDENGLDKILRTQYFNRVYFLKAKGKYHLFNTCNTWLARGLRQAGFEIKDDIILTEQLFNEAAKFGKVLKADYD